MDDARGELLLLVEAEWVPAELYMSALNWWLDAVERNIALPDRMDDGPEDVPADIVPDVLLVDIGPTPDLMRFRFIGPSHLDFNMVDNTGKRFSEVYARTGTSLPYMMGLYAELVKKRRPIWCVSVLSHPETKATLKICRLMLPLVNRKAEVDQCLAAQKNYYSDVLRRDSDALWPASRASSEKRRCVL